MLRSNFELIAEVKTQSPFGFKSDKSWDELFELANEYGDWISIHTDPRWGGSFDLIKKAYARTNKPILAKGIHATDDDVNRAFDAGADYVLVVGRVPEDPMNCIIEPNTLVQLSQVSADQKIVWNQRSLDDGMPKIETFDQARELHEGWLCQASFISSLKDVNPGADAVLVGENLEEFITSMLLGLAQ